MQPMLLHIFFRTKVCLFENNISRRSALFLFCGVHVVSPSYVAFISRPCVPCIGEQLPEYGLVRPKRVAIECDFKGILK
jgi:hypothetical protein